MIRPSLPGPDSVNHRLPSGPATMAEEALLAVGIASSMTVPSRVMRPIWLAVYSVNQRLPSGPAARP